MRYTHTGLPATLRSTACGGVAWVRIRGSRATRRRQPALCLRPRAVCFRGVGRGRRAGSPTSSWPHMSPRRTRAHGQRSPAHQRHGQLHLDAMQFSLRQPAMQSRPGNRPGATAGVDQATPTGKSTTSVRPAKTPAGVEQGRVAPRVERIRQQQHGQRQQPRPGQDGGCMQEQPRQRKTQRDEELPPARAPAIEPASPTRLGQQQHRQAGPPTATRRTRPRPPLPARLAEGGPRSLAIMQVARTKTIRIRGTAYCGPRSLSIRPLSSSRAEPNAMVDLPSSRPAAWCAFFTWIFTSAVSRSDSSSSRRSMSRDFSLTQFWAAGCPAPCTS